LGMAGGAGAHSVFPPTVWKPAAVLRRQEGLVGSQRTCLVSFPYTPHLPLSWVPEQEGRRVGTLNDARRKGGWSQLLITPSDGEPPMPDEGLDMAKYLQMNLKYVNGSCCSANHRVRVWQAAKTEVALPALTLTLIKVGVLALCQPCAGRHSPWDYSFPHHPLSQRPVSLTQARVCVRVQKGARADVDRQTGGSGAAASALAGNPSTQTLSGFEFGFSLQRRWESSGASPPRRPREDGLAHPTDTSRSNRAAALGLLSRAASFQP
jgi:hypothetical protein